MYTLGQKVYIKSLKVIGKITEANFSRGKPRKAHYIVSCGEGYDYLCGSDDLYSVHLHQRPTLREQREGGVPYEVVINEKGEKFAKTVK